jgi:hypothetical protein
MKLPDRVLQIVRELYARHKTLAEGPDDQRRLLTRMVAEQVRLELGPAWGHKSADPTRPPSKDAIAKREGSTLLAWDLFDGTTREPFSDPDSIDITGQHFIDVSPGHNYLGVIPPPLDDDDDPDDEPEPDPHPELAKIQQELSALHGEFNVMRNTLSLLLTRIEAVEARPAAAIPALEVIGSTGRTFGHSHSVQLKVRVVE